MRHVRIVVLGIFLLAVTVASANAAGPWFEPHGFGPIFEPNG